MMRTTRTRRTSSPRTASLFYQVPRAGLGLINPKDPSGVPRQNQVAILRVQIQTVHNGDLLFDDLLPVSAEERRIGAEEDSLRPKRAQRVAEHLFQRRLAGDIQAPVVGPRRVDTDVFSVIREEHRFT